MILTYAGREPRIAASAYIAESADIIGDVEIGENASIWFQTVVRGDIELIRVGANSNVQDGCVVHTVEGAPALIADWVTVGHRAVLHGCSIGSHCLIGMGAVVLSFARVGEGSIIAAGALVREEADIPPHTLYAGVPARFIRQLTEADRAFIDAHASHYMQYKENYLADRKPKR
jgi:carbonic anhydrase/acetyltransferase-like protein (isoleucine patch superfamily)